MNFQKVYQILQQFQPLPPKILHIYAHPFRDILRIKFLRISRDIIYPSLSFVNPWFYAKACMRKGCVLRWPRKVKGRRQYPIGLLELSKRIIIHLFLSSHNRVELGISRGEGEKISLAMKLPFPLRWPKFELSLKNINFVYVEGWKDFRIFD